MKPIKSKLLEIFVLLLFSCKYAKIEDINQKNINQIKQSGIYIYKGQEKILLRGVNIAHTSKRTVIPWVQREDVERLKRFGLNFIRLTIFWSAIEQEKGKYDKNYIEKIREKIRLFEEFGMYVLVDLHQDLYGFQATDSNEGDGIPQWAQDPECPPFKDLKPWMLNYIDESISCQFESFWNDKNGVQTKYLEMFEFIIEQFHEERAVIGFEIMNEPWPGYSWSNTEEWENKKLREFYNKAIKILRKYTQKLFFYETHPLSDFGYPFYLKKPDGDNLVYAPHIYPISGFLGSQSEGDLLKVFNMHLEHSIQNNVPMLVGEYGVAWSDNDAYKKIKEHIDTFDSNFIGSAIWAYDKSSNYDLGIVDDYGSPLSNFVPVIRPYPELVKGEMKKIKYNDDNTEFSFEFEGEYFILKCPEIFSCFIGSEEITQGNNKINKKEGKISWKMRQKLW